MFEIPSTGSTGSTGSAPSTSPPAATSAGGSEVTSCSEAGSPADSLDPADLSVRWNRQLTIPRPTLTIAISHPPPRGLSGEHTQRMPPVRTLSGRIVCPMRWIRLGDVEARRPRMRDQVTHIRAVEPRTKVCVTRYSP